MKDPSKVFKLNKKESSLSTQVIYYTEVELKHHPKQQQKPAPWVS